MASERALSESRLRFATEASVSDCVTLFAQSRVKNFRAAERGLDVRFGSSTEGFPLTATGRRWYKGRVVSPWVVETHWGVKPLMDEFVD